MKVLPVSPRVALPAVILASLVIGARFAGATEVTFRYRPDGEVGTVAVAGTFNGWNPGAGAMSDADGDGIWEIAVDLEPGSHAYKFVLDGNTWVTDETARSFVDDGFGGRNSVLEVGDAPMDAGTPAGPPPPPKGTAVTFRFRAQDRPNAVSVAGSFNGWDAARDVMTDADGDGVWEITLHLEPGEYAYQFVVDGEDWRTDTTATSFEDDGFGGRNARLAVGTEPVTAGGAGR